MLSIAMLKSCARKAAGVFAVAFATVFLNTDPTHAQDTRLLGVSSPANVCVAADGSFYADHATPFCDGINVTFPDGLASANATFNEATNSTVFSGGTVSFNSVTTAFGGGNATFNNTVSFVGPSVTFGTGTTFSNASTFNALADFNNGITSNSITNSGTISTNTLSSSSVLSGSVSVVGSLSISNGATISMGGNVVTGVAAGVVDTDAVNVAQLNAATSGITADVTAL